MPRSPGLMISGNPLLKEAFCNLIGNSIKYSGDKVTIDIGVEKTEKAGRQYYDVIIEDNGNGIPDDVKPKLFRRFQRGTTKAQGKGLGLYIVRSLVEKLGGSVGVENRVPGDYTKGSKFIVSLPACKECKDGISNALTVVSLALRSWRTKGRLSTSISGYSPGTKYSSVSWPLTATKRSESSSSARPSRTSSSWITVCRGCPASRSRGRS